MHNTPDTDQLLQSAAAGDDSAADQLLSRHRGRLRSLVAFRLDTRLGTRVDPSDVVQEVLMTAHRRLGDYLKEQPIAFYPWLRQLALNQLIDLHRRHFRAAKRDIQREVRLPVGLNDLSADRLTQQLVSRQSSPSRHLVHAELKERVMHALEAMPESHREIIVMRHLEGLSIPEIAEILELPEGTVMSRHFRGMQRLRRSLDG